MHVRSHSKAKNSFEKFGFRLDNIKQLHFPSILLLAKKMSLLIWLLIKDSQFHLQTPNLNQPKMIFILKVCLYQKCGIVILSRNSSIIREKKEKKRWSSKIYILPRVIYHHNADITYLAEEFEFDCWMKQFIGQILLILRSNVYFNIESVI
jgi:hypothetical protein